MIKIFFTAFAALLTSLAFSQQPSSMDVTSEISGTDPQVSFMVEIPQTTLKDMEKDWRNYMAKGSKGKSVVADGIYHQSGAFDQNLSAYAFNIHSRILETSNGTRLTVWFTQNGSPLISNDPASDNYLAAKKYIRDFAVAEYRENVHHELKREQSKLSEMEKDFARLIKNEENSRKTIKDNERSTDRAHENIATNTKDIQSSSEKIVDQKAMVEATAADPKATKGAKKTLDGMEKDKENFQKQNESEGRDNENRAKENRQEERNISDGLQHQENKSAEIENQRQKVNEVQAKLNSIK